MTERKRIEADHADDGFFLELTMALVDRLGGDVTITEADLNRVVDGENQLTMMHIPESKALRLRVMP